MKCKLRIVTCDRCGIKYTRFYEEHKYYGFPRIHGISERCVERGWEVCPNCLRKFIAFMEMKEMKEPEFSCDKWIWRKYNLPFRKTYSSKCRRKPYVEVYLLNTFSWSYLCRWHYWMDRLKCKILRIESHGYCKVDK